MANARNTQIEESLKSLLQMGYKYSHMLDKFNHCARSANSGFYEMLCIMDKISQHKTALKKDTAMLNEVIDYYEETETEDDEEIITEDEVHNSYDKLIIEHYSNLMMAQSELNGLLQNYCERVVTVLKQTKDMENRLANQFVKKQKKLMEILVHITEMRKFF